MVTRTFRPSQSTESLGDEVGVGVSWGWSYKWTEWNIMGTWLQEIGRPGRRAPRWPDIQ